MKRCIKILLFPAIAVIFCGCAINSVRPVQPEYKGKKLKTGFYIDDGSRGGGVIHLARLLTYSPQIELHLLKGKDLRAGKLKGLDLLVMPGGSSARQMKSMGPEGVKALQEFVRNGGAYVGVCAGFHITLNRPERAGLMPYTYLKDAVGNQGDIYISLSKEGGKLLNIRSGRYNVRYSRGPIAAPAQWEKGECKTYAVYESSVSPLKRPWKSFVGTPALIAGTYGRGKVIATSFHPEYKVSTYEIFSGCVYAVTGVKLTPQIPVSRYRPLRITYHNTPGAQKNTARVIREVIGLERCPELSVQLGLSHEILLITDLLILPDCTPAAADSFIKIDWPRFITAFMDKGGRVLAVGESWKKLPEHQNMTRISASDCVIKAALEIAAE
ncbi:MAG: hypothetical protein IKA87_10140 [Lentisphaeria bacterium]|nr:hypothetical protein [Lentisphaeria bacterium]